jgi:crotonobetainyl-CoA:carnitine CoA-transferase CaiB-like acyl-CoA transferase
LEKPFTGHTVLELAGVLAGPSVGYFFAELGARVIKIENPRTGGDVTRTWKLKEEDPRDEGSAYFWSVNAHKEFLTLDLGNEDDREKLLALAKEADVLIANYKSGDDLKLGTDPRKLLRLNPRLIYASVNGFGPDSPRTAYDLILQAESGFMSINGEKDARPLKMPVALIDLLAGHQLKEAILIAMLKREKTGLGSHVSVSLFDSAIASLANQATNWLVAKQLPKAGGSLHPNIAPYGEIFDTKDGHMVTFAIGSNAQFKRLCHILQMPQLCQDTRFASNHLRVTNRTVLYKMLYDHVKKQSFASLMDVCMKENVPFAKIRDLKEVFALPEAQAMTRTFTHRDKTLRTVSSVAFRFHDES